VRTTDDDKSIFIIEMLPTNTSGSGAQQPVSHLLKTSTPSQTAAWVAVLDQARQMSCGLAPPLSNTKATSSSSSALNNDAKEMVFFEDEMMDLLDVVNVAPNCCPSLPPVSNGSVQGG
jgi:hypothetical protein